MSKANKLAFHDNVPIVDDEDEETFAAIDEGLRDADAGRTVPTEEVRKLLPKWRFSTVQPPQLGIKLS